MPDGRPTTWTAAPARHSSVVILLPPGGCSLAASPDTPIEAVENRHGNSTFWGVQYDPELSLGENAASTAHQANDVFDRGLARNPGKADPMAAQLRDRDAVPTRVGIAWQLDLNGEIALFEHRSCEIESFQKTVVAGVLRSL